MSYSTNDIETLEYPVCVQRRSGMYLGEPSSALGEPGQANVCVREILDNSTTEGIKGCASHIVMRLKSDGTVVIEDNGRGIPVDRDRETGVTGIEKCMASLHSGGAFEHKAGEKVGSSLNGVGGACVNALSESFIVEVIRKGRIYTETFENGYVKDKMRSRKLAEDDEANWLLGKDFDQPDTSMNVDPTSGTRVTFKLNKDFLSPVDSIVPDDIIKRLKYTVYMVDGLTIDVYDDTRDVESGGGHQHFTNDGGVPGMLDNISTGDPIVAGNDEKLSKRGVFSVSTTGHYKEMATVVKNGRTTVQEQRMTVPIDIALRFSDSEDTDIRSFANTIQTFSGGVHEDAFKRAIVDAFGKLAR